MIPVEYVTGINTPEAWETALWRLWYKGINIPTEYDRLGDELSRDCTMIIEIEDPFAEPRIHKNFPGSIEELESYRAEVIDGLHDNWVVEGKISYTYHERLFAYGQFDYVIEKLVEAPYSRRAQTTTWRPELDLKEEYPPCLQRLWFRCYDDKKQDELILSTNSHWRSRDALKAWFMNVYAITDLIARVAIRLRESTGRKVRIGRYVDISDSFHVYGKDMSAFEAEIKKMQISGYEGRSWRSDDPTIGLMIDEARAKL